MPDTPLGILEADHRAIDRLYARLDDALDRKDFVDIYSVTDLIWMRLAVHIRAEHKVLFPAILKHAGGEADATGLGHQLEELRTDHDMFMVELARAISFLRNSAWHTGCPDCSEEFAGVAQRTWLVRKRLVPHNELEERVVYPLAGQLPEGERLKVAEAIRRELDTLPARFHHPAEES